MDWRKTIREITNPKSDHLYSRIYEYVMLIAIVMGIMPLMFKTHHKLFLYFDLISGICFIIDYLMRWVTADMRLKFHNDWKAFIIYPFTPMAIIDLLSILPVFNLISPTFKVARMSRLLRILRVFKVIRYYEPLEVVLTVMKKQRRILYTVFTLSLFYVFITALIMYNVEEEINPVTGDVLFPDFFSAFYWAACTLTTVGYGDFYPVSHIGRVISIISAMVGIAFIALPSGIMTAGYIEEMRIRKEKHEQEKEKRKRKKEEKKRRQAANTRQSNEEPLPPR